VKPFSLLSGIWQGIRICLALIPALLALFLLVFFIGPLIIASKWLNSED
jgi:hypothetical protein